MRKHVELRARSEHAARAVHQSTAWSDITSSTFSENGAAPAVSPRKRFLDVAATPKYDDESCRSLIANASYASYYRAIAALALEDIPRVEEPYLVRRPLATIAFAKQSDSAIVLAHFDASERDEIAEGTFESRRAQNARRRVVVNDRRHRRAEA